MYLTLIGLIISFGVSFYLMYDTLINFGKPSSILIPFIKRGKANEYVRLEREKDWGFRRVKITKEEIKLIISLFLLCYGFLLQLLDLVIPIFCKFKWLV